MMKPRISVLMGIYNCADTLAEAIDSLYAQTFTDFKLILCDDGSTDNTYQVAKKYADRFGNIVLLRNDKNVKLAATLNYCLQYADTEYIARMDGDDISLPERFQKQIDFLDHHQEYAVVSCPMIYFDETGDWGKGSIVDKPDRNTFKRTTPHAHAACMVRTAVMREVGGYTDNQFTVRVEDYYLWYKIYNAGYKGYNLQEHLYKMRDDQNAVLRRTFRSRYNAFRIKLEVLSNLGVKNPLVYAMPSLLKGFIPSVFMRQIRRRRL